MLSMRWFWLWGRWFVHFIQRFRAGPDNREDGRLSIYWKFRPPLHQVSQRLVPLTVRRILRRFVRHWQTHSISTGTAESRLFVYIL